MGNRINDPKSAGQSHQILGDARFQLYPIIDTSRNEIACYLCQAVWDLGADHLLDENELAGEFDEPGRIRMLDFETLHKALAYAEEIAGAYCQRRSKNPPVAGVKVHHHGEVVPVHLS